MAYVPVDSDIVAIIVYECKSPVMSPTPRLRKYAGVGLSNQTCALTIDQPGLSVLYLSTPVVSHALSPLACVGRIIRSQKANEVSRDLQSVTASVFSVPMARVVCCAWTRGPLGVGLVSSDSRLISPALIGYNPETH